MSLTKKWQKGLITNFEYLIHLNTLAGRSFNDLTQYPVFPFILADYKSETIDSANSSTFRDLTKPMGAQNHERLMKFIGKFNDIITYSPDDTPYFYGSHYSNIGTVLHYMVRLEPFSQYLFEFQSGKFDVPDRSFYSLGHTWELSSSKSGSDVKELIPEFFFFPDFLSNENHYDLGVKQDGATVDDVILPPWSGQNPRKFIQMHREILESSFVSKNLHHWIDLIFGYQQTGEEAIKAYNVFYPLTYEGAKDINAITDPVTKQATIAQINNYGQTPKQIFYKPHLARKVIEPLDTIQLNPDKLKTYPIYSIGGPIAFLSMINNEPVVLGPNKTILWPEGDKMLQWGSWDSRILILDLKPPNQAVTSLWWPSLNLDRITCFDMTRSGTIIAVAGSESSLVRVWKKTPRLHSGPKKTPSKGVDKNVITIELITLLDGHKSKVKCIKVSQEFNIIVSGSTDKSAIIWDCRRLRYVRSLEGHSGPVVALSIHPYLGDIVTVDKNDNGSNIYLWSINGKLISKCFDYNEILCVTFTTTKPGLGKNIIISGHKNGKIKLWDYEELTLIRVLEGHESPVTALYVNDDNTQLLSGDSGGLLFCHLLRFFIDHKPPLGLELGL
eukprot:TRINITY_DN7642_c0_g1_i1.p1 TRINITY_DN7642_c0_g1~~TRINITY_DN7642_c0_g1_i1.p1  ORF type:complete len:629 (+),score=81.03 TRINITY_DN7642_c0_g1_i1:50-1888(+)